MLLLPPLKRPPLLAYSREVVENLGLSPYKRSHQIRREVYGKVNAMQERNIDKSMRTFLVYSIT